MFRSMTYGFAFHFCYCDFNLMCLLFKMMTWLMLWTRLQVRNKKVFVPECLRS
ncbi:hypothetical protein Hanom_Chr05g00465941 [Helianthus anomalus]